MELNISLFVKKNQNKTGLKYQTSVHHQLSIINCVNTVQIQTLLIGHCCRFKTVPLRAGPSINVWKLRVIPVPVSSRKDPVWGDGVGVISLVKPPAQWRYLL